MNDTSKKIVYIVDDDEGIRESLSALLQSVGIATRDFDSAEAVLEAIEVDRPACMLVDVRMQGMSGLELQRVLAEMELPVHLVIITGHGDIAMAVQAMKDGATDFLEKPFNEQVLIDLVYKCVERGLIASQQSTLREQARYHLSLLTEREHEVLNELVDGKPSKKIAAALGLSTKTVDVHRSNIMRKTGVRSTAELLRMHLLAGTTTTGKKID
jgi:two-component system, LuxR family, response regulator FixJ